ncbi:MAG: hypothetical protein ACQEVA_13050 [Myxococcota bacterium]
MAWSAKFSATILLALLLAGGGVLAQSGGTGAEQAEQPESPEVNVEDSFDLIDEDVESLSGEQKLERGQKKIEDMKKVLNRTQTILTEVRKKEKDILKVNCINEKLAAIKGFIKVSEQSYASLKTAVSEDDSEGENHHYKLVAVAHQKVRTLGEEALLCTGEEERYVGESDIEVEVPPTAPPVDDPEVDENVIDDLPELSPTQ